jgi:hypothetical protein
MAPIGIGLETGIGLGFDTSDSQKVWNPGEGHCIRLYLHKWGYF